MSKDVTFVKSTPFFGSSQVGHQGKTLVYGDQSSSDVFPNLGLAPTYSSIDLQPSSIPSPQPPIYSSSNPDLDTEQATPQKLSSPIRYEGSPYVFKQR